MIRMTKKRPSTSLELALLGLIHQEARSGYDLCKIFETTPMGHYSSSPGAIYPALKRLEGRELLAGEVERVKSMRPRRVYSLTPTGLGELEAWVSRQVTHEDLVWRSEELILRFSFMGQLVDRSVIRRFLQQVADGTDALLQGLEAHHGTMLDRLLAPGVLPTGRLALEYGMESYRGLARWARRALAEFDDEQRGDAREEDRSRDS